jgi:dolichol-phosphate mannosyltransferase
MILWAVVLIQVALAARVAQRLVRTAKGRIIERSDNPSPERVTIILPVLNEAARIGPCLESAITQPKEVAEILVVDGGSNDGTQAIVASFRARDHRIRLIDGGAAHDWTGKAAGLHVGVEQANSACEWILCIDADTRCSPVLVRSLLQHARVTGVGVFSVAATQRLAGFGDALIHPAFLATLVYRFGIPGYAATRIHEAQANGQCFIARRGALVRTAAIRAAQHSLCEDITIARRLVECGEAVGFYLGKGLVEVGMYASGRETWRNWPRSLVMRDQYFGWRERVGILQVLMVQAAPLPALALSSVLRAPRWFVLTNFALLLTRVGVLAGMASAYDARPWSYWLSPVMDLPAALRLIMSLLARKHVWRGRTYIRDRAGGFRAADHFGAGT